MTAPDPAIGNVVRIAGHRGVYRVTAIHDDHVEVYGGDTDPAGRRQYRATTPDRLRPATRADVRRITREDHP